MSGRFNDQKPRPKGSVTNQSFQDALAAHARGSFDVLKTIASEFNIKWDEAVAAYPAAFERETNAILARIANAKSRR